MWSQNDKWYMWITKASDTVALPCFALMSPFWLHLATFARSPLLMCIFTVRGHRRRDQTRELWGATERHTVWRHRSLPHCGFHGRRGFWQSCQSCEFLRITDRGPKDPTNRADGGERGSLFNAFWKWSFSHSLLMFCLSHQLLIPWNVTYR